MGTAGKAPAPWGLGLRWPFKDGGDVCFRLFLLLSLPERHTGRETVSTGMTTMSLHAPLPRVPRVPKPLPSLRPLGLPALPPPRRSVSMLAPNFRGTGSRDTHERRLEVFGAPPGRR